MKNQMEYLLVVEFLEGPLAGNTMEIESLTDYAIGSEQTIGGNKFVVLAVEENPL